MKQAHAFSFNVSALSTVQSVAPYRRRHNLEKKHAFSSDLAGLEAFHGELQLIAANALEYNGPDTEVYECAALLRGFASGEHARLRRKVQSAGFIARR